MSAKFWRLDNQRTAAAKKRDPIKYADSTLHSKRAQRNPEIRKSSEDKTPHTVLWCLFARAGLPVPEAIQDVFESQKNITLTTPKYDRDMIKNLSGAF